MKKKRNKSRFTNADVNTICEMQRKIDAYESYIIGLCGLIQSRGRRNYISIERGTEMDDWVREAWNTYLRQSGGLEKTEIERFFEKYENSKED